jgi:predicted Zn-dependent peptidase
MLGEGAGRNDALAFAARKEALGAEIEATGTLDVATVTLSAMRSWLEESLALLSDVVLRPRLAADDIKRVRGKRLASIRQEQASAHSLALRLAGPALYGAGHLYAVSPSGTGTEDGVAAIARADLGAWLAQSFRPDTATLIIVGDTNLTEIVPALEKAFAGWGATASPPPYVVPAATRPSQPQVWLVDHPGAAQSTLLVGQVVPSSLDATEIDLDLATAMLGGGFTSRLPMNLRADKHWAYSASSQLTNAVGPRAWTATAAVQVDKTAESAREMQREILQYVTAKVPVTAEELAKFQATTLHGMPGSYETGDAVLAALSAMALYHRPDDYPQRRADRISALTIQQIQSAASAIQPAALTWIIIGDLNKIEAPIRALGLRNVRCVDAAGRVLR